MVMRNLFYLLLTSSIFIVLFLFLRAAFRKKTSMRLQYALWLLVLGKTAAASTAFREPVFFIYSDPKSGL